jgi:hypothetical protein
MLRIRIDLPHIASVRRRLLFRPRVRLYYLYETLDTTTHAIDVYPLDDEFYRLHVYGEPIVGGTPVAT